MPAMHGSCRCGKVTFSANVEPVFIGVCHCTNCQKETGSAFSVAIGLPSPELTVIGATKTYTATADSGKQTRKQFCPECGSGVAHEADAFPGVIMIGAGSLDDPSWVKPAVEIYCDSAQPWVSLQGGMQRFPKMPG